MSHTYPGGPYQPGGIKKPFAGFLHRIGIEGLTVLVLKFFVAGMCIDHRTYFHTQCEFETLIAVERVGRITKFNRRLEIGGI